jgi:hypothetical protein
MSAPSSCGPQITAKSSDRPACAAPGAVTAATDAAHGDLKGAALAGLSAIPSGHLHFSVAAGIGDDAEAWRAERLARPGRTLGPGEDLAKHVDGSDGLLASLGRDGMLDLYIKTGPKTPRGGQMFDEALKAYGPNVNGIRGTWNGGGDLSDNFDSFKAGLKSGLTPERAAREATFTGHMAENSGFTKVAVIANFVNDDVIVAELGSKKGRLTPVEVAELLDRLTGGGLSQSALVTYFKLAFPAVPLRVLLDAGAWVRVGDGDLSDEGFNVLLRSWL